MADPARILVVDDEPAVQSALSRAFALEDYDVSKAMDGREALERLSEAPYEVVILDISMPHIDGLEVCRRIRTLQGSSPPRMVALTGWGREGDRRRTRDVGFDEHLVKPVSAEKLREVLQGVLNAKRATQVQPDAVGRD